MIDLTRISWARVMALAVGFALVDELLIVPLFDALVGATPLPVPLPARVGWAVVAAFIVVAALALAAGRVSATREQLFVAYFAVLAGLAFASHAQEAYLFQPEVSALRFTARTVQLLLASGVLAAAAARTLGHPPSLAPDGPRTGFGLSGLQWFWRIPASGAVYFVLFMVAGLIIWPFIRDFYAPQREQQRLGLLMMEWEYLNGVWFALVSLPLIRLVPGGWWRAGVTAGLVLCLVRGVAGLIVPGPNLPAEIRLWHLFEVGWSNFVYGLVIAYVFRSQARPQERPASLPASASP